MDPADLMVLPGARACVLLTSLDRHGLEDLLQTATFAGFSPHDPISSRHAADDALHVLVDGAALEQSWASPTSDEYYARPLGVGEVIGITDVLMSEPLPRETRALVPTMTLRVPGMALRELVATSPRVAEGLTRESARALRTTEVDQVVLATGDAMARVTHRVVELATGWGAPRDGGVHVDLPITQAQLGAWAGVSRESAVKCLRRLRRRKLVRTSRRHLVVLDLPALEQLTRRRVAAGRATRGGDLGST